MPGKLALPAGGPGQTAKQTIPGVLGQYPGLVFKETLIYPLNPMVQAVDEFTWINLYLREHAND
jgi:hypothetical protein